jgi:putative Holliday junction resolvase
MRYLGIDYGTKKIGLAFSDDAGTMGFPHGVIPRGSAEASLEKLFAESRVDAVVMGDSRNLDGAPNPVAAEAAAFGEWIARQFGVSVFWEPEVFTSAEARRAPEKREKSRAPLSRTPVDASAAALILTSYLSRHHGLH